MTRNKDISVVIMSMNVFSELEAQLRLPLKEFGMSTSEWLVLKTVYYKFAQTPSGISKYLNIQAASVTRYIDKLVEKKILQRVYQKRDRRVVEVNTTKAGEKVCKQILKKYPGITKRVEKRMEDSELALWNAMFKN